MGATRPTDLELFFGPIDSALGSRTIHFHFEEPQTWADLAAFLKLQPSKTQARKNGWTETPPWGYSELHKKSWQRFYVLNLPADDPRTLEINREV